MTDFQQQYALWDEFLAIWPRERLATMTLDEYTQAGSKDSFTYWIESRLDQLGSIWGGSAFKFGVFSRSNTEDKPSDAKLSYSDTHGWYSSLGATAEEAFEKVRGYVTQVADLAAQGDLDGIDAFVHLGEAFKWKIAFHYQDRQAPVIVAIFTRAPLAAYVGGTANQSMTALQKATLAKRSPGLGILEFGRQLWEAWSQKNLAIWKLSHGRDDFSADERQHYLLADLAVMHGDTRKGQGRDFQQVPVGTLFYLCHGNENLLLVGQFTSAPELCDKGDGWLQRRYRVLKSAMKTGGYQGAQKGWTPNYRSTFKLVGSNDLPEFESTLLKPYFGTDLAELAALAGEPIEAANLGEGMTPAQMPAQAAAESQPVPACINRIYYGPPGTGKTKAVLDLLKAHYTDAPQHIDVEERRRQAVAERMDTARWWEAAAAALHDLGGQATVPELAAHPFIQAVTQAKGRITAIKHTLWSTLQHHTVLDSSTVKTKLRLGPAIFDKGDSSVWRFAGEWQEACADLIDWVEALKKGANEAPERKRYRFVTFHQSYGYEEFIEGLRPVLTTDEEVEAESVAYEIRAGVFKELCREARLSPNQRFALVIDEINRGNISKILGELITLIEHDKRDPLDGSPPPAEVALAYSGEKFSVPANVDVIGTMNTADRSLALLDTALRRRFEFVPLLPDTRAEKDPDDPDSAPLAGLVVTTDAGKIDVRLLLERINERIEALYDRDHTIGHAYFTHLRNAPDGQERFEALAATFRNRIVPLLEEYFFEDWQKIRLVLADNQKPDPATRFVIETEDHEQDLAALFGNDHGLEVYAAKRRYALQDAAFSHPLSYVGIYQLPPA